MNSGQPPPNVVLRQMITGYRTTQMIYVAAKLGIADLLSNGPKGAEELTETAGVHVRSLYRLLRALSSLGILAELDDGRFELTPRGELLQSDVPGSAHAFALMNGGEPFCTE